MFSYTAAVFLSLLLAVSTYGILDEGRKPGEEEDELSRTDEAILEVHKDTPWIIIPLTVSANLRCYSCDPENTGDCHRVTESTKIDICEDNAKCIILAVDDGRDFMVRRLCGDMSSCKQLKQNLEKENKEHYFRFCEACDKPLCNERSIEVPEKYKPDEHHSSLCTSIKPSPSLLVTAFIFIISFLLKFSSK